MAWNCPNCDREFDAYRPYTTHHRHKHPGNALVDYVGADRLAELYAEMSENALADELGVGRKAVRGALEALEDVDRRGQSEAEKHKNAKRSEEERKEQTRAAREAHFEKYGDGGYLPVWQQGDPEAHREAARRAAPLGSPARETNGMSGRTGQDHHLWRGGKSIYDAVKKQLGDRPFHRIADDVRADECYMCGADPVDRRLDVHHIVPILAGGTHGKWNLLTLCRSCHDTAEWRTRDLLDPVLVDG